MQIDKLIKAIVAQPLKKEGFGKAPSREANTWVFAKSKGSYYHYVYITFETIALPSGSSYRVGVNINSSAPRGYGVSLAKIIENPPLAIKDELKFYDTDEQIEEYLTTAVNVIIESAIPLFDCLDRPMILPSTQLHENLSVDTGKRAEDFLKQNDLHFVDDVNGVKEMIRKTETVIKEVQFSPIEEVSGFLVNATAFIGELIRRIHGGEWGWDPHYGKTYLLYNVGGRRTCMSGALGVTFSYWVRPEIYGAGISAHYKLLLHQLGIDDVFK